MNDPEKETQEASMELVMYFCFTIYIYIYIYIYMGFPGGSDGKESACNVGDLGSIPGLGRSPGGEHGNPLQYFCLENPLGQRNLVGNSPQGSKELDTTEWLSIAHNFL